MNLVEDHFLPLEVPLHGTSLPAYLGEGFPFFLNFRCTENHIWSTPSRFFTETKQDTRVW